MAGNDDEELEADVRQGLAALAQKRSQALADAISPIIRSSIDRGGLRILLSRKGQPRATPAGYVEWVADYHEKLRDYVASSRTTRIQDSGNHFMRSCRGGLTDCSPENISRTP
jgi:hypothetical protein